jgi:hypothetical protein
MVVAGPRRTPDPLAEAMEVMMVVAPVVVAAAP